MRIQALHNEQALLIAISDGSHQSFETLFTHYHRPFAQFVFSLLKDNDLTNDVLQDVFLRIWLDREKLADVKDFRDYLFIIARNKVYSLLKQQSKNNMLFEPLTESTTAQAIQEQSKDLEQYYILMETEIEKLPVQQREILKMVKFKKMSYEEISTQLNISIETVRKHVYLATKTLRSKMSQQESKLLINLFFCLYYLS